MCHALDKKLLAERDVGRIVYIKATIAHIGKCGQLGVRIEQPGGYAIVVPKDSEVFEYIDREKIEHTSYLARLHK